MKNRDSSSSVRDLKNTDLDVVNDNKSFIHIFLFQWFLPICALVAIPLAIFLGQSLLDFSYDSNLPFLKTTLTTDKFAVANSTGNFVELLAAILGVVITVVAIVVQLAAQKYSTKLIDFFITDNINLSVFFYMIFTVMYGVLVTFSIKNDFFPFYGIVSLLFFTLLELAILIPYFSYVFKFLTPENIVSSIRKKTFISVKYAIGLSSKKEIIVCQKEVANSLEQITDTALSAISQMDRNIGLMAINEIREIILDYQSMKKQLRKTWFTTRRDQFIGISDDFFNEITEKKNWVEAKAFINMELIFKMSIQSMPDFVSAIANNTRILGEAAIRAKDDRVVNLVIEYFNTFLRVSLNDKNVKAIYNLFYQYRIFTELVFTYDKKMGEKIIFYFKYYGQTAMQMEIWFILVVAAFDLSKLLATAYDNKMGNIQEMLKIFLQIDDGLDPQKDGPALKGARKAQLVLAAYLMSKGDQELLPKIYKDLKYENFDWLVGLRDELLAVNDKKFWEVTDRGINFEYIDQDQKESLCKFYNQFILPNKSEFDQRHIKEVKRSE